MSDFYGNLWAKADHLMETSYLKAHPFGNCYPEWMPQSPFRLWPGFKPHVLWDLSAPLSTHMIPLYHNDPHY